MRLQNDRQIGGYLLPTEASGREFHYLLDGQQRTTALLTSIYGGRIKGQEDRDPHLYVDLTVNAADETEDQCWKSRFLFWDEIDDAYRIERYLRPPARQEKSSTAATVVRSATA